MYLFQKNMEPIQKSVETKFYLKFPDTKQLLQKNSLKVMVVTKPD